MTDNSTVDAAASWVLDNQDMPNLDEPFKVQWITLSFEPYHQYAYSPYCSLYISKGDDMESLFNNQELL